RRVLFRSGRAKPGQSALCGGRTGKAARRAPGLFRAVLQRDGAGISALGAHDQSGTAARENHRPAAAGALFPGADEARPAVCHRSTCAPGRGPPGRRDSPGPRKTRRRRERRSPIAGGAIAMAERNQRATRHTNINEGLIFEISAPGKRGMELPPLDVPPVDPATALRPEYSRGAVDGLPEVSEIEVIRHFTRLSTWNYAIDLGMYPLGSCTMKYNPRVNEFVARLEGLATEHPLQPAELSQGCLRILRTLEHVLREVTGMDAVTLQPCAGAHGEYAGIAIVRAYLKSRGNPRKKVLVPDSAHGTNPATAATAGYEVQNIRSDSNGRIDLGELARHVNDD